MRPTRAIEIRFRLNHKKEVCWGKHQQYLKKKYEQAE